jgi:cytochrome c556
MKKNLTWFILGAAVLGLGLWLSNSFADENKELKAEANKLADLVKDGKLDDLKKAAPALAKKAEEIDEVMMLMAIRTKGGFGFGPKASAKDDGIEAKLLAMAKSPLTAKQVGDQQKDLERMAHMVVALSEVTKNMPNKKKPKEWQQWSMDASAGAKELADAVAKKDAKAVEKAVNKVNKACNDCHSEFK